jgi:hypothetical protein
MNVAIFYDVAARLILSRLGLNDLLAEEMERLKDEEDCRSISGNYSQHPVQCSSNNDAFHPSLPSGTSDQNIRVTGCGSGVLSQLSTRDTNGRSMSDLIGSLTQNKRYHPRASPALSSSAAEKSDVLSVGEESTQNMQNPRSSLFRSRSPSGRQTAATRSLAAGDDTAPPSDIPLFGSSFCGNNNNRSRKKSTSEQSASDCSIACSGGSNVTAQNHTDNDNRTSITPEMDVPGYVRISGPPAATETPVRNESLVQRTASRLSKFAFSSDATMRDDRPLNCSFEEPPPVNEDVNGKPWSVQRSVASYNFSRGRVFGI